MLAEETSKISPASVATPGYRQGQTLASSCNDNLVYQQLSLSPCNPPTVWKTHPLWLWEPVYVYKLVQLASVESFVKTKTITVA